MPERYYYSIDTPPSANFLKAADNKGLGLHVLHNKAGILAAISNYGGRLLNLIVPDRKGKQVEVIEGSNSLGDKLSYKFNDEEYLQYISSRLSSIVSCRNGCESILFDTNKTNDALLELTYSGKE